MKYFIILITFFALSKSEEAERASKLLPVFQVVRFPNDPCQISGGARNGTCYTSEECLSKGGINGGSCASGFGVCCTFVIGCGSTSSENCTYFQSTTTVNSGACRAKICKCSSDICQIRLDFLTFLITGPSTLTLSVGKLLNGELASKSGAGSEVALASRCLTDTFTVSNQFTLPVICGTNSGAHVYFDASDDCNSLDFQFATRAIGISAIATRSFNIKVSQISCFSDNLAPYGCDQWYFGPEAKNAVRTFNFDGGRHLADQDQTICIRREGTNCRICYVAGAAIDVAVTLKTNKASAFVTDSLCCGYGSKGDKIGTGGGQDCIVIPGAEKIGGTAVANTQCGNNVGLVTAMGSAAATVCSKSFPFRITFRSDSYEMSAAMSEAVKNVGFKVIYTQVATNC